jgi:hypothetical protein
MQHNLHSTVTDPSSSLIVEAVAPCTVFALQVNNQGKRQQLLCFLMAGEVYLTPDTESYIKKLGEAPPAVKAAVLQHAASSAAVQGVLPVKDPVDILL